MLAWCRRENNVAVIPVISALAGASRAHRNIWSTGTLVRNPVKVITRSTLKVIIDSTVSDHLPERSDAGVGL